MKLMVPTVYVEAMVKVEQTFGDRLYKIGEFVRLPYGVALQFRALEAVGVFQEEDFKHAEAAEHLQTFGGDSWFPQHLQSIGHVADYLAQCHMGQVIGKPIA